MFASRYYFLVVAAFWGRIFSVHGRVVTLYYVNEAATTTDTLSPEASFSIEDQGTTLASAIGPGEVGMTRYEILQIQSKLVLYQPQTTITFISDPVTRTFTVEQGASTAYASAPPIIVTEQSAGQVSYQGFMSNCSFDASKNIGECIEEDEIPSLVQTGDAEEVTTEIATSTTTYSGALVPLATTSDTNPNSKVVVAQVFFWAGAILALMVVFNTVI